jgi:hypothetical protein
MATSEAAGKICVSATTNLVRNRQKKRYVDIHFDKGDWSVSSAL